MENANWVGVDTHKDTLACYTGNRFEEFKTTPQGFKKLLNGLEMRNGLLKWLIVLANLLLFFLSKIIVKYEDIIIKQYAKIIKELTDSISVIDKEIDKLLPEKVLDLTKICGIEKLTAAKIYTETKGKLTTKEAFANYCAVAPIENSSEKTSKHTINRRVNRTLNALFFRISICQSINDPK